MKVIVRATPAGTISDYDTPEYQPTSFSSDTDSVKEYFGNRPAVEKFDAFLVKIDDGEYTDVLGFYGETPTLGKNVWRVTRTFSAGGGSSTARKNRKLRQRAKNNTSLRGIRG